MPMQLFLKEKSEASWTCVVFRIDRSLSGQLHPRVVLLRPQRFDAQVYDEVLQ